MWRGDVLVGAWRGSKSVGLMKLVGLGGSGVLTSFSCLPDGLT